MMTLCPDPWPFEPNQ